MDLAQRRQQLRQKQVEKVKKFRQSNMSASAAVEKQRDADAAEKQKESAAKQKQREREDIKKEVRKEIEKETQKESMDIENSDGTVFARVVDIIGPSNMKPMVSNGVWKGTDQNCVLVGEEQLDETPKGDVGKDPETVQRRRNEDQNRRRGDRGSRLPDKAQELRTREHKMRRGAKTGPLRSGKQPDKLSQDVSRLRRITDKFASQAHRKEEVELDERLGGKGYKSYTDLRGKKISGDWEDSDRGAGNKAARRSGKKVEKKSPTYQAYVLNKEAKEEQGRSDYGKASVRNKRRFGKEGEPAIFDASGERGKMIDQRRAENKAKRDVKTKGVSEGVGAVAGGAAKVALGGAALAGKAAVKGAKFAGKAAAYLGKKAGNRIGKELVKATSDVDNNADKEFDKVKVKRYKETPVKEDYYSWRDDFDYVQEGAAWTKKAGKNKEGGLNEKGRKSYERENPGSDLKAPQPEGGSRKKSFCARMGGMKKKLTSSKTANDPDSRINKALRKWKC